MADAGLGRQGPLGVGWFGKGGLDSGIEVVQCHLELVLFLTK